MAVATTYRVQGFDHVAGRLAPTPRGHAQSQAHALRQAEELARRLPGAAAFVTVFFKTSHSAFRVWPKGNCASFGKVR